MPDYNLHASKAWYSTHELMDTDQGDRKEILQEVHDALLDGADVEGAVMTAFVVGSAEGVAATVDEHDLDEPAPDP